jgi:S1-C subfamily serine protease
MNIRKLSPYLILVTGVMVILALFIGVAFAAGLVLVPHFVAEAQAAVLDEAPSLALPMKSLQATDSELVTAYEQALGEVYRNTLPSVVNIRVVQELDRQAEEEQFSYPFSPFRQFPGPLPQLPEQFYNQGQGSGFVWDKEGHIVTNYHVVADATEIEVIFSDHKIARAELLGSDPDADLAVIKVDVPASELHPVVLGDSDQLQVGQLALAIGNPFGQEFTMTSGIISAVGRTLRSGYSFFSIPEVIQTDAPINPGNSGGPLLNRQGEVVGINSQIISRSGANAGIGFAIPINIAKQIVPVLIEGETFEYAWLGITGVTLTSEVADFMKLPADTQGVLVASVTQDSPADKAGLQGSDKTLTMAGNEYQLGGDIITHINEQPVDSIDDLITYLMEETKPGDEITLDVIHPDGATEQVTVTLDKRPQEETQFQARK